MLHQVCMCFMAAISEEILMEKLCCYFKNFKALNRATGQTFLWFLFAQLICWGKRGKKLYSLPKLWKIICCIFTLGGIPSWPPSYNVIIVINSVVDSAAPTIECLNKSLLNHSWSKNNAESPDLKFYVWLFPNITIVKLVILFNNNVVASRMRKPF